MIHSRVVETFIDLVQIDSESKNEGKFQDFLFVKFESLGLEVFEDNSKEQTGLGANNLVARLAANTEAEPIFFSSHVDTVAPGVGIIPVVRDGIIYSEGETILAADDKAGIAIMIELIKRLKEENIPHGLIEFVLSPGEEIGLVGAAAFDTELLTADFGFVLDNGGPVGSVTVGSPSLYGLDVVIHGKTAHAGLEPEKGVSAIEIAGRAIGKMKLGRLDERTTANIGTIHGGVASNIVADEVKITAEARSISHEVCEQQVAEMTAIFIETAEELGGTAEVTKDLKSKGYDFTQENKTIKLATAAIEKIGRTVNYDVSGGGSDANVFNAKGKETANLSIGYEKIHTIDEYLPIVELEKAVELAYELVQSVITN